MHHSHTVLSGAAATAAGALATGHLLVALATPGLPPYALVVVLVAALGTSVTALRLLRRNSPMSRLATFAAALLSGGGALLVGAAGLPGRASSGFTGGEIGIIVLSAAVVLLLLVDARREAPVETGRPPYAL